MVVLGGRAVSDDQGNPANPKPAHQVAALQVGELGGVDVGRVGVVVEERPEVDPDAAVRQQHVDVLHVLHDVRGLGGVAR